METIDKRYVVLSIEPEDVRSWSAAHLEQTLPYGSCVVVAQRAVDIMRDYIYQFQIQNMSDVTDDCITQAYDSIYEEL